MIDVVKSLTEENWLGRQYGYEELTESSGGCDDLLLNREEDILIKTAVKACDLDMCKVIPQINKVEAWLKQPIQSDAKNETKVFYLGFGKSGVCDNEQMTAIWSNYPSSYSDDINKIRLQVVFTHICAWIVVKTRDRLYESKLIRLSI